jgi:hypothetical protein
MTMPEDDKVGYKRPPKSSRWQPGQSGNPKRRRAREASGVVELIDTLMLSAVDITENGKTRTVSTLEAILLQVWLKEVSGNHHARRVRLKYEEFARQNMKLQRTEITFVDNDYTRALSNIAEVQGNE